MQLKTAIRHINLLNIILMTAVIIFAGYILLPMHNVKFKYTPPATKKDAGSKEEKAVQIQTPSLSEFTIVAEQNIFHPERKIPLENKDAQLPRPEFVLYGTLITGDESTAFLEDLKTPYSTPGRGKRQRTMRKGEIMSGYTLSEIYGDKVAMVRGDDRIEVNISDTAKSRISGAAASAATGKAAEKILPMPKQPVGQISPAGEEREQRREQLNKLRQQRQ